MRQVTRPSHFEIDHIQNVLVLVLLYLWKCLNKFFLAKLISLSQSVTWPCNFAARLIVEAFVDCAVFRSGDHIIKPCETIVDNVGLTWAIAVRLENALFWWRLAITLGRMNVDSIVVEINETRSTNCVLVCLFFLWCFIRSNRLRLNT